MKGIDNFGIFTNNLEKTKTTQGEGYLAELNVDCDNLSGSSESIGEPESSQTNLLEVFLLQEGKIQFQKSGLSTELDSYLQEDSASSHTLESLKGGKSTLKKKSKKSSKMQVEDRNCIPNLEHRLSNKKGIITIEEAVCSQKGSRKWQEKLSKMRPTDISAVIRSTDIAKLMLSRYGNYFCQVMFEKCNQNQISCIISQIRTSYCVVAKDIHGTHSLQKIISLARNERTQRTAVDCLEPYFLELALV